MVDCCWFEDKYWKQSVHCCVTEEVSVSESEDGYGDGLNVKERGDSKSSAMEIQFGDQRFRKRQKGMN